MLESIVTVHTHTHTSNLIEEKSQAFYALICDICER